MFRLFAFALFIFSLTVGGTQTSLAQEAGIVREEIEWLDVWIPGNSNKNLPRVLLIGDSITRGYYGEVENRLKGKATVSRLTTSKSLGDPGFVTEVEMVLSQTSFDLVHFNNGLHGWGYTEEEYAAAFPNLIKVLRKNAPKAQLIWATTTPMRMGGNLGTIHEKTERIKARNEIAAKLTEKERVQTDDLYSFLIDKKDWFSNDGVHLNGKGNGAMAEKVAMIIAELLGAK